MPINNKTIVKIDAGIDFNLALSVDGQYFKIKKKNLIRINNLGSILGEIMIMDNWEITKIF